MIDHRLGGVRQEVGMVLGKPASAGFLLPVENAPLSTARLPLAQHGPATLDMALTRIPKLVLFT